METKFAWFFFFEIKFRLNFEQNGKFASEKFSLEKLFSFHEEQKKIDSFSSDEKFVSFREVNKFSEPNDQDGRKFVFRSKISFVAFWQWK